MNPKSTLLLFLLVLGLGGAVWWQTEREESGEFELILPLFEGVDRARITALRVDNIERGVQVKLERDASRIWYVTDPVEYPAEMAVVKLLLDIASGNQMVVVSEEERRLAAPGFDPPRAHVEVTELLEDGRRRTQLVEVGPKDIDGAHVIVRRDGKLYKTPLNLDNTITRDESEYRSRKMFDFDPRLVRSLKRVGSRVTGQGVFDVGLEVQRSGIEWRMVAPHRVAADGRVLTNFVTALSNLRLQRFVSEGQHPLEHYGLHLPELRFEVTSNDGSTQTLLIGQPSEGQIWFAKRENLDQVWQIKQDIPDRVSLPASAMFRLELLPLVRSLVESIDLAGPGGELRLARAEGGWTVSERRNGSWGLALAADTERAEKVLAEIENARVSRYLLDVDPEVVEVERSLTLAVTQQGQSLRVRFAGVYHSEEGSEALQAWRDGDRIMALVPPSLGELFELGRRDLQSLSILQLDEIRLTQLELQSGEVVRTFRRNPTNSVWKYIDMDAEAVELRPVLDKLFFLRAESHLEDPAPSLPPLANPIEVRIDSQRDGIHAVLLGLGEDGKTYADHLGTRSLVADPGLHGQLVEILARKQ